MSLRERVFQALDEANEYGWTEFLERSTTELAFDLIVYDPRFTDEDPTIIERHVREWKVVA